MQKSLLTACFLVQLSCLPATAEDQRVKSGLNSLRKLEPANAIRHLTGPYIEAARTRNNLSTARYLMLIGIAFRTDDNIAAYLSCARMALALRPEDPQTLSYAIDALLRASRIDEARLLVERSQDKIKHNAPLSRSVSTYLRTIADYQAAEKLLEQALKLDPNDAQTYILKARHETSNTESARLFDKAASLSVDDNYMQELLWWQRDRALHGLTASPEHLLKAKEILPSDPGWKSNMAFSLLARGKQQEAMDMMVQATQTPRLSLKALGHLSTYCAFNNNPTLAMQAADRSIQLASYLPESHFARGHVYAAQHDWPNAEKDFLQALALSPRYNVAYEALSDLPPYSIGSDKFLWLLTEWTKNCPNKVAPWLLDGAYASRTKNWQRAYDSYARACQQAGKDSCPDRQQINWCRALAGCGTALYKLGRFDQAVEMAQRFNQKKPEAKGPVPIRLPKIDLSKQTDTGPKLAGVEHALLADMLYETNELDDCVAEYEHALKLDNNPAWHRGLLKAYIDKRDLLNAAKENVVVSNDIVTKGLPGALADWSRHFQRSIAQLAQAPWLNIGK